MLLTKTRHRPACRVHAGRCRFPLMLMPNQNNSPAAGLEASLPEHESNAPADIQYHNITTRRKPRHTPVASLGLLSQSLRQPVLSGPTGITLPGPGASTRRDTHLALALHLTTTTRLESLSRTLEIVVAASAHRKGAARISGSHGANTSELCSPKRTSKHRQQRQT